MAVSTAKLCSAGNRRPRLAAPYPENENARTSDTHTVADMDKATIATPTAAAPTPSTANRPGRSRNTTMPTATLTSGLR